MVMRKATWGAMLVAVSISACGMKEAPSRHRRLFLRRRWSPRIGAAPDPLKRLQHHEDDDADDLQAWHLVDDAIEALRSAVAVGSDPPRKATKPGDTS